MVIWRRDVGKPGRAESRRTFNLKVLKASGDDLRMMGRGVLTVQGIGPRICDSASWVVLNPKTLSSTA